MDDMIDTDHIELIDEVPHLVFHRLISEITYCPNCGEKILVEREQRC